MKRIKILFVLTVLSALIFYAHADWATTTLPAGTNPRNMAINPVTNMIYVANYSSYSVTVINGSTNATTSVPASANPQAVAVNPVTNKIYVTSNNDSKLTVIDEAPVANTQVWVQQSLPTVTVVHQSRPAISGKAVISRAQNKTAIMGVLNDWMTGQQAMNWAAGPFTTSSDSIGWTYNWGNDSLLLGENYVIVVPLDILAATSNNLGLGTPMTGNALVCPIYRMMADPTGIRVAGRNSAGVQYQRRGLQPYLVMQNARQRSILGTQPAYSLNGARIKASGKRVPSGVYLTASKAEARAE